jgi:hypothetical protein
MAAVDVRRRLSDPQLAGWAVDLGFRDLDVADLLSAVEAVLHSVDDLATVTRLAAGLLHTIGYVGPEFERRRIDLSSNALGTALLPMLALLGPPLRRRHSTPAEAFRRSLSGPTSCSGWAGCSSTSRSSSPRAGPNGCCPPTSR